MQFKQKYRIALMLFVVLIAARPLPNQGPTEIVTTIYGLVFVKNPPQTDKQVIEWWKNNKEILKNKYHLIPDDDFFSIPVMDFGDGYVVLPPTGFFYGVSEEDYLCNPAIQDKKRCVVKKNSFDIMGNIKKGVAIYIEDRRYEETPDGKVTRTKRL